MTGDFEQLLATEIAAGSNEQTAFGYGVYVEDDMALCAAEVAFQAHFALLSLRRGGDVVVEVGIGVEGDAGHDVDTGAHLHEAGDGSCDIDGDAGGTYADACAEMVEDVWSDCRGAEGACCGDSRKDYFFHE